MERRGNVTAVLVAAVLGLFVNAAVAKIPAEKVAELAGHQLTLKGRRKTGAPLGEPRRLSGFFAAHAGLPGPRQLGHFFCGHFSHGCIDEKS